MHRSRILAVEVLVVVTITSVIGLDLTSPSLSNSTTPTKNSTPDVSTSTLTATSRRALVHCEITLGSGDERPEVWLETTPSGVVATPITISGSGCDDQDAVTSLTLKIAADGANGIDLLPVCRFSNVDRVTIVGRPLNGSVTSLNCFRNIRHVTLTLADVDVFEPSLIYDSFRSSDLWSVVVFNSGVNELRAGVFDGRRMMCLEEVDLSKNNLTKIINLTFTNLQTLTTVNLSHNAIRYIAPQAFANIDIRYSIHTPCICISYTPPIIEEVLFWE